jgi:glutamate/tyrosine decarboxylase-like PLP-dependent enzyme
LIPFWYGCSWGTTATCSYDPIEKLGILCKKYNVWFNVDAAYAGVSWVIPEYRAKVKGLELADSLQVNFAKLMLVTTQKIL